MENQILKKLEHQIVKKIRNQIVRKIRKSDCKNFTNYIEQTIRSPSLKIRAEQQHGR